ncbi:MAG: GAF domain-containing protein [Verrucomicrobia bacterium]|nr:GAF domain-containing protein [Verrucomicrobiota bacterium]
MSASTCPEHVERVDSRRLIALHRIAALATHLDDPHAALTAILHLVVDTFHADAASVALVDPDTSHLRTEVATDNLRAAMADDGLRLGHGITGWCVLNRRPLLVPDVATEPRYIAVRPAARCEMAAPIMEGEQIIGIIDLESDRTGGFVHDDLALLEQLAAESALVLQRLWQLSRLKDKARQLESLITAGQSLVTKLEQYELFDTLTHAAGDLLRARTCALYLHDAAARTLRCAFVASAGTAAPPSDPLPLDNCLLAAAINTRRQVAYLDVQAPEYAELADLPRDPALRSLLATPLLFEGEVLCVLAVFTDRLRRFDNDEKRLCSTLASLGAVALENARLYSRVFQSEDTLRKNERLTTLGLLAAEIAHEIRNPLTVLKLLHGGLGLDFATDDPRRTDMRVIGEKLDQLESIVTRVLGFAKAPTSLHSRWALADIVEDTLVLVRLKLAQSKVTLRFDPPAHPFVVEAHKGQLQQVLLNLLINSTQAMPDGGNIAITATPGERDGARVVWLDLADNGTGIPEKIRDRVFDSFLSGRPDGTGLGLAIAKRILLSHHGDIHVLTTSPAGTTMRLTLPLV